MADCEEEQLTRHYRGAPHGFGPVLDSEQVVLAVFETTPRNGSQLCGDSFENNLLKKHALSLARGSHVTRSEFDNKIAGREQSKKGAVIGIAVAEVAIIRALQAEIKLNAATQKVRAICVLDRVDEGDADGHATAGYGESTGRNLSQTQMAKVRAAIRLDFANAFSQIFSPNKYPWPSSDQ